MFHLFKRDKHLQYQHFLMRLPEKGLPQYVLTMLRIIRMCVGTNQQLTGLKLWLGISLSMILILTVFVTFSEVPL